MVESQLSNVHLAINIGRSVHFLNVYIENQDGRLFTRVYHDPSVQKYTLPYVIGHSKVAHSHWLRSALIRAVRYCTSVDDFDQERIYLEVTCLANGYSLDFVEKRISHFYHHFDALSLRLSLDQHVYDRLRHRLFNFISEQQRFIDTQQELEMNNQLVRLSYRYQYGPRWTFNQKLHEMIAKILHTHVPSSQKKIKIILNTNHQYSLNALLSQQKPLHC